MMFFKGKTCQKKEEFDKRKCCVCHKETTIVLYIPKSEEHVSVCEECNNKINPDVYKKYMKYCSEVDDIMTKKKKEFFLNHVLHFTTLKK